MTEPLALLTATQLRELVADAVAGALASFEAGRAPEPDLVSSVEMARRLCVSRTKLHRLRLAGCPAVRVGDTYRYRPSTVLAWLEEQTAGCSSRQLTERTTDESATSAIGALSFVPTVLAPPDKGPRTRAGSASTRTTQETKPGGIR